MPFWTDVWGDIETPVQALIGDAALFLVGLTILAIVYLALVAIRALGISPTRLEVFETIHYYAYLVVLAMLLLDLIGKVALHVFSPWVKMFREDEPNSER